MAGPRYQASALYSKTGSVHTLTALLTDAGGGPELLSLTTRPLSNLLAIPEVATWKDLKEARSAD